MTSSKEKKEYSDDTFQNCSQCKCKKLLKFFSIKETTGKIYKTCMKCRDKHRCAFDGCNKSFGEKSDLNKHIRHVHQGIKNHTCDICNKSFGYKHHLNTHIRVFHQCEKNHTCDICNKSFGRKDTLDRHTQTCTGDRYMSGLEKQCLEAIEILGFREDDDFYYDQTDEELTKFAGIYLRMDFKLTVNDTKIFIETDGRQHFEPVCFGGISEERALEKFRQQKINDKIKDDFCKKYGYKLIRICYKDIYKVLEILSGELYDFVDWIM